MNVSEIYAENSKKFLAEGGEVLLFGIGENTYGIEIQYITEIIGIQPITIVPKVPDYIKGVINIRGKVIPVMSIRRRFGKDEIDYDDKTCIIVIDWDNVLVGLIADNVQGVVNVRPSEISNTPDYKRVNTNRYIRNIIETADGVKLLLDCNKIIND